jgi:hypothetical protein
MSSSHRIITTGTALVLCPVLENYFGTSPALVLQQLHYWLSKENNSYGIIDNGCQWIRNSYSQWQKQIKVRSLSTIRRAFSDLECQNIIKSKCFDVATSYIGGDQVKYFTINYDQLENVIGNLEKTRINVPSNFSKNYSERNNKMNNISSTITKYKPYPSTFLSENQENQPETPLKMSTPPVQNEHPPKLYITKTTSENISIIGADEHPGLSIPGLNLQTNPAKREIFQQMIFLWNKIVEQTPDKIALTPGRSRYLATAYKQFFGEDLAQWESFCLKIASSKFLMGEVTNFRVSLDWALQFSKMQRILEGGYTFGDRFVSTKSSFKNSDSSNPFFSSAASNVSNREGQKRDGTEDSLSLHSCESEAALAIRTQIVRMIGEARYRSWFLDTIIHFEETDDGETRAILSALTPFRKSRLETEFSNIVDTFFYEVRLQKSKIQTREPLSIHPERGYTLSSLEGKNPFLTEEVPVVVEASFGLPSTTYHNSALNSDFLIQPETALTEKIFPQDLDAGDKSDFLIRSTIMLRIGEPLYMSWFKDAKIVLEEEGRIVLIVRSAFIKDRIEMQFSEIVKEFFDEVRRIDQPPSIHNLKPQREEVKTFSTTEEGREVEKTCTTNNSPTPLYTVAQDLALEDEEIPIKPLKTEVPVQDLYKTQGETEVIENMSQHTSTISTTTPSLSGFDVNSSHKNRELISPLVEFSRLNEEAFPIVKNTNYRRSLLFAENRNLSLRDPPLFLKEGAKDKHFGFRLLLFGSSSPFSLTHAPPSQTFLQEQASG